MGRDAARACLRCRWGSTKGRGGLYGDSSDSGVDWHVAYRGVRGESDNYLTSKSWAWGPIPTGVRKGQMFDLVQARTGVETAVKQAEKQSDVRSGSS